MSPQFHEYSEGDFYDLPASQPELLGRLSNASSDGVHLHGGILGMSCDFPSVIRSLDSERANAWGISISGNDPYLISITLPEEDSDTARAFMWKGLDSGVIQLAGAQDTSTFNRLLRRTHRFLYPDAVRVNYRTVDVLAILNSLVSRNDDISIRILEYTARSLIDDPIASKRVDTIRRWTDESYEAVFQALAEQGQWLSAFRFEARGSASFAGRMWRGGTYLCEFGFMNFYNTLLKRYEEKVSASKRFYSNRDRKTSPTGASRPVKLIYKRNVFSNKSENYRFIQAIKRLSDCSVAVVHPNPYIHASILDYMDGSTCEIWVTTNDSVLILPQEKASGQSVQRICDHICDLFEEGDVVEYSAS